MSGGRGRRAGLNPTERSSVLASKLVHAHLLLFLPPSSNHQQQPPAYGYINKAGGSGGGTYMTSFGDMHTYPTGWHDTAC